MTVRTVQGAPHALMIHGAPLSARGAMHDLLKARWPLPAPPAVGQRAFVMLGGPATEAELPYVTDHTGTAPDPVIFWFAARRPDRADAAPDWISAKAAGLPGRSFDLYELAATGWERVGQFPAQG
jgi:hypothetical protein